MNIRQLSKSYGDQEVFHSFNYDFQDRSLYWIKGKNGCGKTTIFKLIYGLYKNFDGKLFINDIDILNIDLSSLREKIFMC